MASRRLNKANTGIRFSLKRAKILAASGAPSALKMSLMGFTKRGGAPLRLEKLRRKLPRQLRGVNAREHIRPHKF